MPASIPPQMRAAAFDRFGGPGVLHAEVLPVPRPGPDQVLVRLDSAGIGVWDPWVRSGEFDRIVGRYEYPRRGDPVDARADGGEAVSFYSQRIRDAFREAGESVNSVGQQLAEWLRGTGREEADDAPSHDDVPARVDEGAS